MHILIGLAILFGILYLIYLLIVNIIIPIVLPIAGVVFAIGIACSALYGFISSIGSFYRSFRSNLNPYRTYVDKKANTASGVRRSYFFGPGYHQIFKTVKDAFAGQKEYLDKLNDFRREYTVSFPTYNGFIMSTWAATRNVFIFSCYIVAVLCVLGFGFLWICVFSLVLASIIFTLMCLFFVFFGALWLTDRFMLLIKSIQSRCGNCKLISTVPNFICPNPQCGNEHKNLTPGPYGVFKRTCTCSTKIPTTFLNGRSRLKANCPYCTTELAASDARQFGIQIIGGVAAGKTSFMVAFWHHYIERLKSIWNITYERYPADAFDELEQRYQQGLSSSTSERNANMYSIVHTLWGKDTYQMTLYDIAGEAFSDLSSDIQQQQFRYCEGLVFILDPTADPSDVRDTFSDFIKNFDELKGKHVTKVSDLPVSVVLSKADLFKKEIGLVKINARYRQNPYEFVTKEGQDGFALTRDVVCREFLVLKGFNGVCNLLDGEFNNLRYFPVSAMGHPQEEGNPYEPWGVMEPIMWILSYADEKFKDAIQINVPDVFARPFG